MNWLLQREEGATNRAYISKGCCDSRWCIDQGWPPPINHRGNVHLLPHHTTHRLLFSNAITIMVDYWILLLRYCCCCWLSKEATRRLHSHSVNDITSLSPCQFLFLRGCVAAVAEVAVVFIVSKKNRWTDCQLPATWPLSERGNILLGNHNGLFCSFIWASFTLR